MHFPSSKEHWLNNTFNSYAVNVTVLQTYESATPKLFECLGLQIPRLIVAEVGPGHVLRRCPLHIHAIIIAALNARKWQIVVVIVRYVDAVHIITKAARSINRIFCRLPPRTSHADWKRSSAYGIQRVGRSKWWAYSFCAYPWIAYTDFHEFLYENAHVYSKSLDVFFLHFCPMLCIAACDTLRYCNQKLAGTWLWKVLIQISSQDWTWTMEVPITLAALESS